MRAARDSGPLSSRYAAVLFDLDGTLIDSREDLVRAVRHGFREVGAEPPDPGTIIRFIGQPLIDFPSLLGYQFTSEQKQEFARRYRAYYSAHCGEHTEPFPGVRDTLGRLLAQGLRMAVVTTKSQDQAEGTVRVIGLTHYFAHIRGWSDGQKLKPDPEPLAETVKALGVSARQALMVGDSEQDILAAQAAGIDSCACLYGFRDPDYLRSLNPTYAVEQFADIRPIILREADRRAGFSNRSAQ